MYVTISDIARLQNKERSGLKTFGMAGTIAIVALRIQCIGLFTCISPVI